MTPYDPLQAKLASALQEWQYILYTIFCGARYLLPVPSTSVNQQQLAQLWQLNPVQKLFHKPEIFTAKVGLYYQQPESNVYISLLLRAMSLEQSTCSHTQNTGLSIRCKLIEQAILMPS